MKGKKKSKSPVEKQEMSPKPGIFVVLELPTVPFLLWRRIHGVFSTTSKSPFLVSFRELLMSDIEK